MCGSAVAFNPVTINDGTVMMWYKEFGANDGNPQQLFNPLANHAVNPTDKTIIRSPADFGWDLSLVGGRFLNAQRTHDTQDTQTTHTRTHSPRLAIFARIIPPDPESSQDKISGFLESKSHKN